MTNWSNSPMEALSGLIPPPVTPSMKYFIPLRTYFVYWWVWPAKTVYFIPVSAASIFLKFPWSWATHMGLCWNMKVHRASRFFAIASAK